MSDEALEPRTTSVIKQQISAMGSEVFEIGLYDPNAVEGKRGMILRTWDATTVHTSVAWLRYQNRAGRNIYIRPNGEHDLTLIDDLAPFAIRSMKETGFDPAVVVETSPGNYQAWLRHPERLKKEVSTAVARALAQKFGGDRGAADWRHFGRLAGLTENRSTWTKRPGSIHSCG